MKDPFRENVNRMLSSCAGLEDAANRFRLVAEREPSATEDDKKLLLDLAGHCNALADRARKMLEG